MQGCDADAPNDACCVIALTLRFDRALSPADCSGMADIARKHSATILLRSSHRVGRTYALLEAQRRATAGPVRDETGAKLYETAIIALAVYPTPVEALPALRDAFCGAGRPTGVLECSVRGEGAVIEWDPQRCSAALVSALVDVELRRFGGARTAELLSPLPQTLLARIVADGLGAPEITPDRILETLLHRAGLSTDG
jgi:hypothetical protein